MIKMRDASNALAPQMDSVPAERPSAGGCAQLGVLYDVSSDASNALAPRATFASADGEFEDLYYFDDAAWHQASWQAAWLPAQATAASAECCNLRQVPLSVGESNFHRTSISAALLVASRVATGALGSRPACPCQS